MADPTITFTWPPNKDALPAVEVNYDLEELRKWLADRNNSSAGTRFAYLDTTQTFTGAKTFSALTTFTGNISFPNLLGVWRGFNVKDYGALGNGTTDDTVAIQAAIVAAEAVYGGALIMPYALYKITDALRIKKSISIYGVGGTVPGPDHTYTTDSGAPTDTMGVIIKQVTHNKDGFLIKQDPVDTYSIRVCMENITIFGDIGTGGSSGNGITVDAASIGNNIQCYFNNVNVEYFQGYGIKLVEGYFASSFNNIMTSGNGLTGFYAIGTSQGEYSISNLRAFGNGSTGATETDQCGLYIGSGGGISLYRVSCTSNKFVQAMFEGCSFNMFDFWSESFLANNANDRALIFKNCQPFVYGAAFSPQSLFLGKLIDCRGATNGIINGIKFLGTVDPSGYHIYEDGSSGSNKYQVSNVNGTLYTSMNSGTTYGAGNAQNILVMGNPGAALTQTIAVTTPASSSRTWTIPDITANATFAALEGTQTFSGTKTFSAAVTVNPTSNQLVLGATRTVTVTAPTPASSSRTWTIPDISGDGTVAALEGTQTFSGSKTFSAAVTITPTTNQVILGTTRTATLTAPTPASSSRTYTFPDQGADYSVVATAGTQTVSGTKTFDGQLIGKGTATSGSAAAGYIGEYIESVVGFTDLPATGVTGDLASISLTAGDWDVSANTFFLRNGATYTAVDLEIAITSTSGDSGTGIVNGSNMAEFGPGASALLTWSAVPLCVPSFRVSLSGTTTYYLKVYAGGYSAGTPRAAGRISARRVR